MQKKFNVKILILTLSIVLIFSTFLVGDRYNESILNFLGLTLYETSDYQATGQEDEYVGVLNNTSDSLINLQYAALDSSTYATYNIANISSVIMQQDDYVKVFLTFLTFRDNEDVTLVESGNYQERLTLTKRYVLTFKKLSDSQFNLKYGTEITIDSTNYTINYSSFGGVIGIDVNTVVYIEDFNLNKVDSFNIKFEETLMSAYDNSKILELSSELLKSYTKESVYAESEEEYYQLKTLIDPISDVEVSFKTQEGTPATLENINVYLVSLVDTGLYHETYSYFYSLDSFGQAIQTSYYTQSEINLDIRI